MFDQDAQVLLDRRGETELLDGLIAAVRRGESWALVVRGGPEVGKTALLAHLARAAADCGPLLRQALSAFGEGMPAEK